MRSTNDALTIANITAVCDLKPLVWLQSPAACAAEDAETPAAAAPAEVALAAAAAATAATPDAVADAAATEFDPEAAVAAAAAPAQMFATRQLLIAGCSKSCNREDFRLMILSNVEEFANQHILNGPESGDFRKNAIAYLASHMQVKRRTKNAFTVVTVGAGGSVVG